MEKLIADWRAFELLPGSLVLTPGSNLRLTRLPTLVAGAQGGLTLGPERG